MNIYWNENSIPALKGLSQSERHAAKRAVIRDVWKHWQVWLPFTSLLCAYAVFLVVTPQFPYRLVVATVSVAILVRLAVLPFNHYLQVYVGRNRPEY
jgi:hypothetical protein